MDEGEITPNSWILSGEGKRWSMNTILQLWGRLPEEVVSLSQVSEHWGNPAHSRGLGARCCSRGRVVQQREAPTARVLYPQRKGEGRSVCPVSQLSGCWFLLPRADKTRCTLDTWVSWGWAKSGHSQQLQSTGTLQEYKPTERTRNYELQERQTGATSIFGNRHTQVQRGHIHGKGWRSPQNLQPGWLAKVFLLCTETVCRDWERWLFFQTCRLQHKVIKYTKSRENN